MNKTKTILIVDDTETNIDILLELLSDKYDILVALDAKSTFEIVQEERIDLILLDIMMPNIDGYETCKILKANNDSKDIPIIFITAKTDEDSIQRAYEVGGIDYVSKPFKSRELLMRVKTQLKLQELLQNLERLASYDTMTDIYNRRKLFELGTQKFNESKVGLCAVMIDIDKFKEVNDRYGHPMGDSVIKKIASTISHNIPAQSIFARLGGDEFAIITDEVPLMQMRDSIDLIRIKIKETNFITDDKESFQVTISSGLACYHDIMKDLDALLKEADKALYEAKEAGRDRVVFR